MSTILDYKIISASTPTQLGDAVAREMEAAKPLGRTKWMPYGKPHVDFRANAINQAIVRRIDLGDLDPPL